MISSANSAANDHEIKQKTIDSLLDKLSIEEKVAQMMVLAVAGTTVEPLLVEFIRKYGLGGLRISPYSCRQAIPNKTDSGSDNIYRPLEWRQKAFDIRVPPRHIDVCEYAGLLNDIRRIAFEHGEFGLPMHVVADFEANGGDFSPYGMMSLPYPMGFGSCNDNDLIFRAYSGLAKQIKSIGIDWIHSPVVDVNVNPKNPEISARAYHERQDLVTKYAKITLEAFRKSSLIGTLKHFPGRGASDDDAHFAVSRIDASKSEMYNVHIKPYQDLIASVAVPSIMLAHSVYPELDASGEISTVSQKIVTSILREDLGYQGVITTDSMTMGGLMSRHSVAEAGVMAVQAGVDLLLMKSENSLRWELHSALVEAVKTNRLTESRINQSLRRIWSLKWDYGLFENGGIVVPEESRKLIESPEYRKLGREASEKVMRVIRDEQQLLPLRPAQKVLLIDKTTIFQQKRNDSWNYPGMMWDFMRKHSENIMYIDYLDNTAEQVFQTTAEMSKYADIIVVTADYNRNNQFNADKQLVKKLAGLGKPLIMIGTNPYPELLIPNEAGTVIITYGLMREQLEAAAEFLYKSQS